MRKILSVLLVCALLCLCACGKAPQKEDGITGNYKAAVAAIDSGDYQTAYDLLKNETDEQSKELLSHLVFVPTKTTSVIVSDGVEMHFSTELTYDEKGLPLKLVYTDKGNKTENVYTYDENGRMLKLVSTSEGTTDITDYTYDEAGRLIRTCRVTDHVFEHRTDHSEIINTYTYDEKGNLTEETRTANYLFTTPTETTTHEEATTVTYRYNDAGKETLKRTTFKDGGWHENESEYRADGTLYKTYERSASLDEVYMDEYDEKERLWKSWILPADEDPYVTLEYTYNEAGQMAKLTRMDGASYYTYDANGNLTEESDGSNRTVYAYDANGNRLTETYLNLLDQVQWERKYTYDENGWLVSQVYTSAERGTTQTTTYTYDAYGNKTTQLYTANGYTQDLSVAWTLFYYPDEIPEVVADRLYNLSLPPNMA